jgi:nitrogenase molybdenum-iron protein alpha/beta subunit
MATFEANGIEAIRRVASSGVFEGEDANLTMNLMALHAVRSPEMRENMRGFHERVARQIMNLTLATKERYESEMERLRTAGKPANDLVTYEDMKDFVERGEYEFTVRREYQMGTEFQLMPTVLHELGKRLWTVYTIERKHAEEAQQTLIAAVNRHMIQHSFGEVFSREKEVLYADRLLRFRWDDKVVQRFTTSATKEELDEFYTKWGESATSIK